MAIPPRMVPNVLEFKFPGVQGIGTSYDPKAGELEIIEWPEATLGRGKPTQAELDTWYTEWQASDASKPTMTVEEELTALKKAIKDKNLLTDADIEAATPADKRPRKANVSRV